MVSLPDELHGAVQSQDRCAKNRVLQKWAYTILRSFRVIVDDATVELVVKLAPAGARSEAAHNALLACATDLGIGFEPVDRSTADSELAGYHVAHVTRAVATRAIERLRQCDGVEAAFTKPRGEPPNGGMQNGK
jgi:hypothetical protein